MLIFSLLITLLAILSSPGKVLAISDPLVVPNNKLGLHLLFPEEVPEAAKIVNNYDQGAWGYVVIPIQAADRDRFKWQKFFDRCLENKVIPIIRVATVTEGSNWLSPDYFDLIDFANFLGDLDWPVKNRYLIIYNEVNRADEYGGLVSPENYADILSHAIDIFKEKSDDFFILPSALDNAASDRRNSIYWKDYLWRMYRHQPDIFSKLDGWNSHAYANPDFSARPDLSGSNKIDSYQYDLQLLKNFTTKKLPVFITEAGWSGKYLTDQQISFYYQYAFTKVWSDSRLVTVSPFLLDAQDGPFKSFSFLNSDHKPKEFVSSFSAQAQIGEPVLSIKDISPVTLEPVASSASAVLGSEINYDTLLQRLYNSFKSLLGLLK